MSKTVIFLLIFILTAGFAVSVDNKVNPDNPKKGNWDFQLKKVWETQNAGEHPLVMITALTVSDDGKVFARDRKQQKTFIFNPDGKFVKSFAPRGEGPGEVKVHFEAYHAGEFIIMADFERLHYFKTDGTYAKSVPNTFFARRPAFFIDKDQMVTSPLSIYGRRDTTGQIKRLNLSTKKETVISEFKIFAGGQNLKRKSGPARLIIIVGLSPLMTVGQGNGKIYYGISNQYKINAADTNGEPLFSFGVKRENRDISKDDKKKLFAHFKRMSEEDRASYIKNFPDTPTYFSRIEEIGKHIYVFAPDPLHAFPGHSRIKHIDIFSLDGTYRYKAAFKFEKGLKPLYTIIKNGFLYAVLENEAEEEIKLVKYKITLP